MKYTSIFLGIFPTAISFVSVQNCETYPPARGKNKQALKSKVVFACFMGVKQQKFDLHLSKKEIPKKTYT
jgi:hypothetical protein